MQLCWQGLRAVLSRRFRAGVCGAVLWRQSAGTCVRPRPPHPPSHNGQAWPQRAPRAAPLIKTSYGVAETRPSSGRGRCSKRQTVKAWCGPSVVTNAAARKRMQSRFPGLRAILQRQLGGVACCQAPIPDGVGFTRTPLHPPHTIPALSTSRKGMRTCPLMRTPRGVANAACRLSSISRDAATFAHPTGLAVRLQGGRGEGAELKPVFVARAFAGSDSEARRVAHKPMLSLQPGRTV